MKKVFLLLGVLTLILSLCSNYCLQPGSTCAEDVVIFLPKLGDYERLKEDINYIHISDFVKKFSVEGYKYEISVTPEVSTIFYHFKHAEYNQIVIPFKY